MLSYRVVFSCLGGSSSRARSRVYRAKRFFALLSILVLSETCLLGCSAISSGMAGKSSNPSGTWTPLNSRVMPELRAGAAMAYDAATKTVVLFGGSRTGFSNATWTWGGRSWTKRHPTTSPPPSQGAVMAYNPPTRTVVLFSGVGNGYAAGTSKPFDETWIWNGRNWSKRHPRTSPPRAHNFVFSLDPSSGNDILFGGCNTSGCNNATWQWNGHTWRQIHTAHSPPPMSNEILTSSGVGSGLVLYGGVKCHPGSLKQSRTKTVTWIWRGDDWHAVRVTPRPLRYTGGAAAPAGTEGAIMFGGRRTEPPVGMSKATWLWRRTRWYRVQVNRIPKPRQTALLVYDSANEEDVLFGGFSIQRSGGTPLHRQMWLFKLND